MHAKVAGDMKEGRRRFRDATPFFLPWYSGGGLWWGFVPMVVAGQVGAILANPHPNPPPEYQGRG